MCRAITCLSYCIAVTTKSLLFAAEAYSKLEPTLRFLDLVSLRIRRGTLRTEPSTPNTLESVPLEVWDRIRYELIELEHDAAEQRIGERTTCADCLKKRRQESPNRKVTWELRDTPQFCDFCVDVALNFRGLEEGSNRQTIDAEMLRPFRLRMSTGIPVRLEVKEWPSDIASDPDTAVLITIAVTTGASRFPLFEEHSREAEAYYEQNVVELDPLDVPPNADSRFAAFVSRFHLDPVDVFDQPDPQERDQSGETDEHIVLNQRTSKRMVRQGVLSPGWQLFTTCLGEW